MTSESGPCFPASAGSSLASNGPASARSCGKLSATRGAARCSPRTGPTSSDSRTSAGLAGCMTSAVTWTSIAPEMARALACFHPSISSAGGSPVRMCPRQARELASMVLAAASGGSTGGSSPNSAPLGPLSKMSPAARIAGLMPSAQAWQNSATKRYRSRLQRRMLGRRTAGIASSWSARSLPTPTAKASDDHAWENWASNPRRRKLPAAVLFPTPTAGDAKSSGSRCAPGSSAHAGTSLTDATVRQTNKGGAQARGHLSPRFVEWMMGLPRDWTNFVCDPLEMPLFRTVRKSSGK